MPGRRELWLASHAENSDRYEVLSDELLVDAGRRRVPLRDIVQASLAREEELGDLPTPEELRDFEDWDEEDQVLSDAQLADMAELEAEADRHHAQYQPDLIGTVLGDTPSEGKVSPEPSENPEDSQGGVHGDDMRVPDSGAGS